MVNSGDKINEAIEFFETMLATMPGDRTSLECLIVAYDQVGEVEKRRKCMIQLVDTLLAEQAYEDAQSIANQLKSFRDDTQSQEAINRVYAAIEAAEQREGEATVARYDAQAHFDTDLEGSLNLRNPALEIHAISRAALSAEMDLVWSIKDREILPREVCEELIRTLTEFPVNDRAQLISALALLDDQHPEWTDKIMEELITLSHMPAIPLELFSTDNINITGLSSAYITIRGVFPFARMDAEYLVGILNPLDINLQQDISKRLGTTCHFFLVHPGTCQEMLDQINAGI
jgi:hypothetical protein